MAESSMSPSINTILISFEIYVNVNCYVKVNVLHECNCAYITFNRFTLQILPV